MVVISLPGFDYLTAGQIILQQMVRMNIKCLIMWRKLIVHFSPSPLQHGITEVKVEETADGHILHLQAEDTLIQLEEDGTHIVCDNNEPLRTTLRDLVLRFLQKL